MAIDRNTSQTATKTFLVESREGFLNDIQEWEKEIQFSKYYMEADIPLDPTPLITELIEELDM